MSTNHSLSPGKELGQYELLLPVAQGGMATVWAARRKGSRGFQKTVAIKTMLPALSDDPTFETMFLEEARLAARIHHPSVAEILDLGEEEEILYIVMEWVDGEALSVISRAAKKNDILLPQRIALRIVGQACLGLHAAHELRDDDEQLLGLVHRDVSPQNILVTYDGHVKLVDFGVAKATNRSGGETTAGQLKGKIPYMSPEQARGAQVDRRTDIFAMGIVLYKLTTGIHPFSDGNDLLTMRNIISRPVLPPRARNPRYSAELEQVVMKCLHKDPTHRYETMLELERAVQWVLAKGAPVTDEDVGTFVRTLLGDRGQKRRAALRDAVRTLDERMSAPPPSSEQPLVHEGVSELVLTQMNSGMQKRLSMPSARPSIPSGISEVLPDSAVVSGVGTPSQLPLAPVELPAPRRHAGMLVAVAALGAAVALGAGLLLFGRSPPEPPPEPAAPVAALDPTGAAPAPPPDLPKPTIEAVATTVEPVAPPPDAPDTKPVRGSGAGPARNPGAGASTSAPVKPPSSKWVPTVKDPGF